MTLSLRLNYMSICLSYLGFCHFETRELTPSHSQRLFRESQNDTFTKIKLYEYLSELLGFCHFEARELTPSHSQRLFRESQNDTFTKIKLYEYLSELLGVLSF